MLRLRVENHVRVCEYITMAIIYILIFLAWLMEALSWHYRGNCNTLHWDVRLLNCMRGHYMEDDTKSTRYTKPQRKKK